MFNRDVLSKSAHASSLNPIMSLFDGQVQGETHSGLTRRRGKLQRSIGADPKITAACFYTAGVCKQPHVAAESIARPAAVG